MRSDIPGAVTLVGRLMQFAVPSICVAQILLLAVFVRPGPYATRDQTQSSTHVYGGTTVLVFLIVLLALYSVIWVLLGRWIRHGLPLVRLGALVLAVVSVAVAVDVLVVRRSWTTSASLAALCVCQLVILGILLRPDFRAFSTLGPAGRSRPASPDADRLDHVLPSKHRDRRRQ